MVDEVMAALDGLSRREHFTGPDDLVFGNTVGRHLSGWRLHQRFHEALEAAGLPRVRFHDLRHCFATLAVQKLPLPTVQGYLGHAHIATTMRYVHHTPAARDVALLGEAIRAGVSPIEQVSGHARDTPPDDGPVVEGEFGSTPSDPEEAPTRIELVYTALQAAA